MSNAHLSLKLPLADADQTAALGRWLAPRLGPGDVILLSGDIGAGKTHLARAIIQTRLAALGLAEDVPSPTFTLVQVYDAGGLEIWHADLYRLTSADEVIELGLEEAFETALCLVEWPDRLGPHAPGDALSVTLTSAGEGREITLAGPAARWSRLLLALPGWNQPHD